MTGHRGALRGLWRARAGSKVRNFSRASRGRGYSCRLVACLEAAAGGARSGGDTGTPDSAVSSGEISGGSGLDRATQLVLGAQTHTKRDHTISVSRHYTGISVTRLSTAPKPDVLHLVISQVLMLLRYVFKLRYTGDRILNLLESP